MYILIERFILHSNTAVVGARLVDSCLVVWMDSSQLLSIWVFLLLGSESIRTFKSNPYFRYVLLLEAIVLC